VLYGTPAGKHNHNRAVPRYLCTQEVTNNPQKCHGDSTPRTLQQSSPCVQTHVRRRKEARALRYLDSGLTSELPDLSHNEKIALTNGCPVSSIDGGITTGRAFLELDAMSSIPASWHAPIQCRTPRVPEASRAQREPRTTSHTVQRALSVLPEGLEEPDERGVSPSMRCSTQLQFRATSRRSVPHSDVSPLRGAWPKYTADPCTSITLKLPLAPSGDHISAHTPPLIPSDSPEVHTCSAGANQAPAPEGPQLNTSVPLACSLTLPLPKMLPHFDGSVAAFSHTTDEDAEDAADAADRASSHRTSASQAHQAPGEPIHTTQKPQIAITVPSTPRLPTQPSFPRKPRTSFRSARGPGPPRPSLGLQATRSLRSMSSNPFATAAAAAVAAVSKGDDGQRAHRDALLGVHVATQASSASNRWREAAAAVSAFSGAASHGHVSQMGGAAGLGQQSFSTNVMEMSWCAPLQLLSL
jgi:hypothetical protein